MKFLRNTFVVLVCLGLIVFISAQVLVNSSFVKDKIKTSLEQNISRQVKLDKLHVSFLKGLAIEINNFCVYEKNGKDIFVGLKSLKTGLNFMPLLSKKVEITSIELIEPEVNIIKYLDGSFNYSDMLKSQSSEITTQEKLQETALKEQDKAADSTTGTQEEADLPNINIAYIIIKNASLLFKQEVQKDNFSEFPVKGLNISTKDFSFTNPLNLVISSEIGKKASIRFDGKTSSLSDIMKSFDTAEIDSKLNLSNLNSSELTALLPKETLKDLSFTGMNISSDVKGSIKKGLDFNAAISTDPLGKENNFYIKTNLKCFVNELQQTPQGKGGLLEKISLNGNLNSEQLTYRNNTLNNSAIAFNVKNGTLSLDNITTDAFNGNIKGQASMSLVQAPAPFKANLSADKIDMKNLLTANANFDQFTGTLKASLNYTGTGFEKSDLEKFLQGNTDISIKDAVYTKRNIKEDILNAMNNPLLAQAFPGLEAEKNKLKSQKKETKINDLIIKTTAAKGTINVNTLTCGTEDFDIDGNGTIDFNLIANLKVQMILSESFTKLLLGAAENEKKSLPDYLPQKNGRLVLPAIITGPLSDPKINPDFGQIIGALTKGTLTDSLKGTMGGGEKEGKQSGGATSALQNILGGGSGDKKEGSGFKLF